MPIDHKVRARKAWPYLVGRAAEKDSKPFSYGELSGLIGLHARSARYFLSEIQDHCRFQERPLPRLQAFAVSKRTKVPGDGYLGSRFRHYDNQGASERQERRVG